jgi:hypothetical protein
MYNCVAGMGISINKGEITLRAGDCKQELHFNLTGPIPVVVIKVAVLGSVGLDLVEDRSTK